MSPKSPSKGRSPAPNQGERKPNGTVDSSSMSKETTEYTSHGITDNDIFKLPSSDYQLLGLLTAIAAIVRLFRIYQPSSVVFDEVQYASLLHLCSSPFRD